MTPIDAAWRAAHPLPTLSGEVTKDSRGTVLVVGGSRSVPGAVLLTGGAALRSGAGKVRIATARSVAAMIGVAFPEAGSVPLEEDDDGEVIADGAALEGSVGRAHAVALGPGISDKGAAVAALEWIAPQIEAGALVLDAVGVACAGKHANLLCGMGGRLVLTPHHGEMASLLDCHVEAVGADPREKAVVAAERFNAVVVLKGVETFVATPTGALLHYGGGGPGLATGGSGDVLAGVIAGLLSRGTAPEVAAGWAVWLHGEAGATLARTVGPIGFLGRELLPVLPGLLPR